MTQPGESTGYNLADHVNAIEKHGGKGIIDTIIVNNQMPPAEILKKYIQENSIPVFSQDDYKKMNCELIEGELLDYSIGLIRHNSDKLSRQVVKLIEEGL